MAYPDVTKRRLLPATEGRHALLALFHPSPLLVGMTEPLDAHDRTRAGVRRHLRNQLKLVLHDLDVRIDSRGPHLPIWKLVVRLEAQAGKWPYVSRAWNLIDDKLSRTDTSDGGLTQLLSDWRKEAAPGQLLSFRQVTSALSEPARGGSPDRRPDHGKIRSWND